MDDLGRMDHEDPVFPVGLTIIILLDINLVKYCPYSGTYYKMCQILFLHYPINHDVFLYSIYGGLNENGAH